MKLVVVDYGTGNVKSLISALGLFPGVSVVLSNNRKEIDECDGIVLPGVGSFGHVASFLHDAELDKEIIGAVHSGRPILGICLGMQLFFENSMESPLARGLGILPGRVRSIQPVSEKVPNIGWRETVSKFGNSIGKRYYCHSYVVPIEPSLDRWSSAVCYYGSDRFCAFLNISDKIVGFQYHPEKSGKGGLSDLESILEKWKKL
jgi:imidazole glycerol phosphate synthase glutamine amidotransferase subunit